MTKRNKRIINGISFYAFFINGMLAILLGTILNYLIQDVHLSYLQAGTLISVQSIGNLISGAFSGIIIYTIKRKNTLILFSSCFFIGLGGILFTSSYPVLLVLLFISGFGWGICTNIINLILVDTTGGEAKDMLVISTFYAMGSFLVPILVNFSYNIHFNWKLPVAFVSVGSLILFLIFLFLKKELIQSNSETNHKSSVIRLSFLREPRFHVCFVLYFTYVGTEVAINSWFITFLSENKIMSLSLAQTMLSLLWLTIIISRFLTSTFGNKLKRQTLLSVLCFGMVFFFALILFNKNQILMVILILFLGIFMAGVFPLCNTNAREYISGAGVASGILFAGGGLGASVIPYLTGHVIEKASTYHGMFVILFFILLLFIFSLINHVQLRNSLE